LPAFLRVADRNTAAFKISRPHDEVFNFKLVIASFNWLLSSCKTFLTDSVHEFRSKNGLEMLVLREITVKRFHEVNLLSQRHYCLLHVLRYIFSYTLFQNDLALNLLLYVFNCFLLDVLQLLNVLIMQLSSIFLLLRISLVKRLDSHFYTLLHNLRLLLFEFVEQFVCVIDKLRVLGDRFLLKLHELVLSHLQF